MNRRLLLIAAVVVAVFVAAAVFAPSPDQVVDAIAWMQDLGPRGWLVFTVVFLGWTLLALPASWPQGAAGFLFGPVVGFLFASVANTLFATVAFVLARTRLRTLIADRVSGDPRIRAIDHAVGHGGLQLVVVLRMSPLSPYNVMNYLLAATRVPLRSFVLGTWIGTIPPVLLYSYLGSTVGDLSLLLDGTAAAETGWFTGLVLGITLVATALVTRFAQTALKRALTADGLA